MLVDHQLADERGYDVAAEVRARQKLPAGGRRPEVCDAGDAAAPDDALDFRDLGDYIGGGLFCQALADQDELIWPQPRRVGQRVAHLHQGPADGAEGVGPAPEAVVHQDLHRLHHHQVQGRFATAGTPFPATFHRGLFGKARSLIEGGLRRASRAGHVKRIQAGQNLFCRPDRLNRLGLADHEIP